MHSKNKNDNSNVDYLTKILKDNQSVNRCMCDGRVDKH